MLKHRPCRGFSLIEMLVAGAIAALLASLATPTFVSQWRNARRSDAIVRLAQLQHLQERWRANSSQYGTLAQTRTPAITPDGHYALSVREISATGYTAVAAATGSQADDSACRVMQIVVVDGEARRASGATAEASNPTVVNNRCWNP